MKSRVTTKGAILLPARIRRLDGIKAGQTFVVERLARGRYLLTRHKERANVGLVDWLSSCPVKDIFVPIESESTSTL